MTEQTAPSTLTKTVVVDASRDHAFEVFTKRFDSWWPREHHLRRGHGRSRARADFVTEVEVRFFSEGDVRTRVELEHRDLDRFGEKEDVVRGTFESPDGWAGLLERFAREAAS